MHDFCADFVPPIPGFLLPRPRCATQLDGTFKPGEDLTARVPDELEEAELHALDELREVCARIADDGSHRPVRLRVFSGPSTRHPDLTVCFDEALTRAASASQDPLSRSAQSYRLRVTPAGVELRAAAPPGLTYGLRTLCQMVRVHGRDWPCIEIDDAPAFGLRGLSFDVSRGKVPTLETLILIADRLALLKANHLQLYIEHTFAFRFNPNISRDCSPLTPSEIRALDRHCRRRRIALVPSLASFGHMGRVLSLPEYRPLAEIEARRSFEQMTWFERMHGLTLDATNPQSRELLEQMYAELLPCFSAPFVNVCCDETYDLGKGKTRALAEQRGVGQIYLDHLHFLHGLCRRHGKRMMFWGDILKKYPDLLKRVPHDAIALNWDYAPDCDYQSTRVFRGADLATVVCPATHGWNRIVNDLEAAQANIRGHAAAGAALGAIGLLNTDWGDEGHVNLLACAWHPIALGAALGWNSAEFAPAAFDAAFARLFWNEDTSDLPAALRRLAGATSVLRAWPKFCEPLAICPPRDELSAQQLADWRAAACETQARLDRATPADPESERDMRELSVACQFAALLAERFILSRALQDCRSKLADELRTRLLEFAAMCDELVPAYSEVWLVRNKPDRLPEIVTVIQRLAAEARAAAGGPSVR